MKSKQFEAVIGLEVHVELSTKSKIFCGCSTAFGSAPNTHTCPVCTGMPGSLPVLNRQVLENAIAVGLATNCEITQNCKFDRKNYFYPDNPQNYQISQLYLPICRNGYIEVNVGDEKKRIRIHEIHMEEDAGKLIHDPFTECTMVDYNRSGVPLLEIVSEPDMNSAEDVIAFLDKLRLIIQYLGVSDCKLQEGSMRADINLSVHRIGEPFGIRTETKNLNSFKAITHAIDAERRRQIELIEEGKTVIQESRRWDDNKQNSYSMRSKEDAKDYRYFPEPDLPSFIVSDEWIKKVRARQPEFKDKKMQRYIKEYLIPEYDAEIITSDKKLADLFEACTDLGAPAKEISNLIMGDLMRLLKEKNMELSDIRFSPEYAVKLIDMIGKKIINRSVGKQVFEAIFSDNVDPEQYVNEHNLATVSNEGVLRDTIVSIVANNPKSVEDYKAGKKKAAGFLIGQTMHATNGKADPALVNKVLFEILGQFM